MLYGWRNADGAWRAHTRVSNSTHIDSPALLQMADHVYVGHFNTLDASGGLTLGEGDTNTTDGVADTRGADGANWPVSQVSTALPVAPAP